LVGADCLRSVHSAVCVGRHTDSWSGNPKPSAAETVAVANLEYVTDRRLRCSSDLYEVVGAGGFAVGQRVVLGAADRVREPGQLRPVRRAAGCVRHLLRDIAEAKGSNSEADVALASLPPPTDGIMLA